MTCYVDDITFSGAALSKQFLYEVKKIIHRNGLSYHKEMSYDKEDAKLVTGVIVKGDGMKVPNKLMKSIYEGFQKVGRLSQEELRSLAGKCNAAAQIEDRYLHLARRARKLSQAAK